MRYIYLLFQKNTNVSDFLIKKLENDLSNKFQFSIKVIKDIEIPDYTYNNLRKQYNGRKIINELNRLDFPEAKRILAIFSVDLYAEGLNFIFGEAESPGKIAIISTARLNPQFYNQKYDPEIFYQRILKEAIHELGHTFSLSHCPNSACVMYFSNTIEDTDAKTVNFCGKCQKLLEFAKF